MILEILAQIDPNQIKEVFSLKDVTTTGILIAVVYYFYNEQKRLSTKVEDLNAKLLETTEKALESANEFKRVIETNTKVMEKNTEVMNTFLSKHEK